MNVFADILTYPFRRGGKYILLIGAILSLLSDLVSLAPVFGGLAYLFLYGYFCATYFKIIESSATGGKEAPEFPDLSNVMEDIIWPMLQITVILLVSLGPLLIYIFQSGDHAREPVLWSLLAFGAFYAPMAILAVVVLGFMGAVSPHIVLPSIFRAGWLYLAAVILLLVIYGLQILLADSIAGWFLAKHLILSIAGMYCMMANGRALGLVFREKRENLNWI